MSMPVHLRQHVGYNREFLDSYEPNKTFYLTRPILDKLEALGVPEKIPETFLIDLSWNSSRLEGNTYSLLETEKLLATGEEAPGKDYMETQMILNHKDAIEFIVDMAAEININRYTILNIHALLSNT